MSSSGAQGGGAKSSRPLTLAAKQEGKLSSPSASINVGGQSIVVGVRVRGFRSKEDRVLAVRMSNNTCQLTTEQKGKQKFTFDHCFWSNDVEDESMPYATQMEVFQSMGMPLVESVLDGYNCCLLAYGPTGSGKTYSMFGKDVDSKVASAICSPTFSDDGEADGQGGDDGGDSNCSFGNVSTPRHKANGVGLIPRVCDEIFTRLNKRRSADQSSGCDNEQLDGGVAVTVSVVEIYQDDVYDLLSDHRKELAVRSDGKKHYCVMGATSQRVSYFEEIEKLLVQAERRKTIHATAKNAQSSRAHTLVELHVQQNDRQGKVIFADLAGSENAKEAQSEGIAFEQLKAINLSLLSLGKCIEAASRGYDPDTILAFRDSTLTKLLKEYVGGNSRTSILITIAPGPADARFSIQALRFGDRAKHIMNHAQINNVLPSEQVSSSLPTELGGHKGRVYLYYGTKDYAASQLVGQLKALVRQEQALRSSIELEERKVSITLKRQEERDFVQAVKVEEARRKINEKKAVLITRGRQLGGHNANKVGKRFSSVPTKQAPSAAIALPPAQADSESIAKRASSLPPLPAVGRASQPPPPPVIMTPPSSAAPKAISPRSRHRPHNGMQPADVAADLDDGEDDDEYQRLNTAEKRSRRRRIVIPGASNEASSPASTPPAAAAATAAMSAVSPTHREPMMTSPVRVATPPPAPLAENRKPVPRGRGGAPANREHVVVSPRPHQRQPVASQQTEMSNELIKRIMIESEEQQARKGLVNGFAEQIRKLPAVAPAQLVLRAAVDVVTPQRKTQQDEGGNAGSTSDRRLRPSPPPKPPTVATDSTQATVGVVTPQRSAPNRARQLRSLVDHEPQERDAIARDEEIARKALVDKRRVAGVTIALSSAAEVSRSPKPSSATVQPGAASIDTGADKPSGPVIPSLVRRVYRPLHEQEIAGRESILKAEGDSWRGLDRQLKSGLRSLMSQSPPTSTPAISSMSGRTSSAATSTSGGGLSDGGLSRRSYRQICEDEDAVRAECLAAEVEGRRSLDHHFRSLIIALRAAPPPPLSPTTPVPRRLVRPMLEEEIAGRENIESEQQVERESILASLRGSAVALLDTLGQRFVRFAIQQGALRPDLLVEYNNAVFGPSEVESHAAMPLSVYDSVVILTELWKRRRESLLLAPRAVENPADHTQVDSVVSKHFEKAVQLAKTLIVVEDVFSDPDDGEDSTAQHSAADEMSPIGASQPHIDDFEIEQSAVGSPGRRQQRLVSFLGDFKLHSPTDLPEHALHRTSLNGQLEPALKPGALPSQTNVELPAILTTEEMTSPRFGIPSDGERYEEDDTDSRASEEPQDPLDDGEDFDGQIEYHILPEINEIRRLFAEICEPGEGESDTPISPGTLQALEAKENHCSDLLTDMAATMSDRRTKVLAADPTNAVSLEAAVASVGEFFVELVLQSDEHRSNVAVVRAMLQCARQDRIVPAISLLELSEKRELLACACHDASLHFLRLLLQQYQVSKLYPRGALCGISLEKVFRAAMFHKVHRIRMVQILLKYCTQKAAFPTLSRALLKAAPDLATDWGAFFGDICSESMANPGENRTNRLHLARAMLSLTDYTELDPFVEGVDKLRIFDRAAMEGDLDVLHIFKDCLPPHTFAELILSNNGDGSNCLILGVLANDLDVVTFVVDELRELVPEYREEVKGVLRKEHQGGHALKLARTLRRDNVMIRLLAEPYAALRIT